MEEKNSIKVILLTFFLILAIILIILMAYYIHVEKLKAKNEIATLEESVVGLQTTVNELQEEIKTISNTSEEVDNSNNTSNMQDNQSITNDSIIEDIIGEWYSNSVIWGEEERGLSNYYGIEIAENNCLKFYSDGTYVKSLGTYYDNGRYQISGDYVYMTSNISGATTVAQYCEGDYSGNDKKHLVELESGMVVFYLNAESLSDQQMRE